MSRDICPAYWLDGDNPVLEAMTKYAAVRVRDLTAKNVRKAVDEILGSTISVEFAEPVSADALAGSYGSEEFANAVPGQTKIVRVRLKRSDPGDKLINVTCVTEGGAIRELNFRAFYENGGLKGPAAGYFMDTEKDAGGRHGTDRARGRALEALADEVCEKLQEDLRIKHFLNMPRVFCQN